jgi:CheY-like chemotaxis protein
VLLNLVGNAIKFTDHGEVTLRIRRQPNAPDIPAGNVVLAFEVLDTGLGLSPEQSARLFSAFTQADTSTTRKFGGTGLGLTISKRLVELMNGHIGVSSSLGAGSNFHFTARLGLQTEQPAPAQGDENLTGVRVLVVDDNAAARANLLSMLASQRFEASAVADGPSALVSLADACGQGQPFGVVLIDWMMPGMDGLALVRHIRSQPLLVRTPVVLMVTAHSREEMLEQARGVQIEHVLQKPVEPSSLLESVLLALGREVVTRGRKQQRLEANLEAEQKVRGAHLLLVEDNRVNQELALEILQGAGIRVDVANHGAQAVDMVARTDYDGVLMDCQMPVMDGFAATRAIRADARRANLPIMAMTANAMGGDRDLCLAAGMNDHIGKPIDMQQLFTTLARWVTPRHATAAPAPHATGPAEALPVGELPAIEGLDLDLALRRLGGRRALVGKLLDQFAHAQAPTARRIAQAALAGDWVSVMGEAHTLKGLAGNIGALALQARAQDLERATKNAQLDALEPAVAALQCEMAVLAQRIRTALDGAGLCGLRVPPDDSQHDVDGAALQHDMATLAALLSDDDSGATRLGPKVAQRLAWLGHTPAADALAHALGRYDFDAALQTLQTVAQALHIELRSPGSSP